MRLEEFSLERIQSVWEHIVEINLAESGIEPLRLGNLMDTCELRDVRLGYPQTNGGLELRRNITSLFTGATEEHVLVTNGGSEANNVALWWLRHENPDRDHILVELPNYMQIWGLAGSSGLRRDAFWLREDGGQWRLDIEDLKEKVTKKTLAVTLCTPNNPTGSVLSAEEIRAVVEIAEDHGAVVLSDEVYRGAELRGGMSPSVWEHGENVLITGGLSKAYAVPGLRVGWIVARNEEWARQLWAYTDYTSISPSLLGDLLGTLVLDPVHRDRILERNRRILRENWAVVEDWLESNDDILHCIPPRASAVCIVRYDLDIGSESLAQRLIRERNVLIAPGDHFLLPHRIRIGYGHNREQLEEGLRRVTETLREL